VQRWSEATIHIATRQYNTTGSISLNPNDNFNIHSFR
jgi:hypothetical protein